MEIIDLPQEIPKILKEYFEQLVRFSKRRRKLSILLGILILLLLILLIKSFLPRPGVKIKISGPEKVKAGELIKYTVSCKNVGNIILENPELVFHYSAHSIPQKRDLIETIGPDEFKDFLYPGQTKSFEFKARLFGATAEKKEVKSWLTYNQKGKKVSQISPVSTFSTQISKVPIDLELDVPSKIPVLPKEKTKFEFGIRYISFIDFPLSNLKLKVGYPKGFRLESSKPERKKENLWQISELEKNETGEVEIWGEFPKRQEFEKQIEFSAKLYLPLYGEDVLLKEAKTKSLTYKPVFLISQKINSKSEYITSAGERLHYQIFFKNVSETPQRNLVLTSTLEGKLFDLFTIESPKGETKPGDNSIVWSGEEIPELRYMLPGEEGKVEFWIKLKLDYKPKGLSETMASIKNKVSLIGFEKGFRTKVNSKIEILQEGYYKDRYGFFENSGLPPKVSKTTTYTIVWKILNFYNPVKGVKVQASLPPQVDIKSIRPLSQGKIRIEETQTRSKKVIWEIEKIESGTGIFSDPLICAFQISFIPIPAQKGKVAELIGEADLLAKDMWTGQNILTRDDPIDTTLPDDPIVREGEVK